MKFTIYDLRFTSGWVLVWLLAFWVQPCHAQVQWREATAAEASAGTQGPPAVMTPRRSGGGSLTPAQIAAAGGVTNLLVPTQIKQVAYIGVGFTNSNYNILYVQSGNITNQTWTNFSGGLPRYFANDRVNSFMVVNTNVVANADGSSFIIQYTSVPLLDNSNNWFDDNGNPTTAHMLRTNITVTAMLPVDFTNRQDDTLYIDLKNGNDATAIIGAYPFKTDLSAMLAAYSTNPVVIKGDAGFTTSFNFGLQNGQNFRGDAREPRTLSVNCQLTPSVSNIIENVFLTKGSQIEANDIANVTFRHMQVIELANGSGDSFGVNISTNSTWDDCVIFGYVNCFQCQTYGTNNLRNIYVKGQSRSDGGQNAVPFFSAKGTLTANQGVWNIINSTFELDNLNAPIGGFNSACIDNNQTNCVFYMNNVTLNHYGNTHTAIKDGTGTAIFYGTWTDNGTNMVGYGIAGLTGHPLVSGPFSGNGSGLTNVAQNTFTRTNFLLGASFTNTTTRNVLVTGNARCNPTTTGSALLALVTSPTGVTYTTNSIGGMEADVIFTTAPHPWTQLTAQVQPGGIWKFVDVTGDALITMTNCFYQTLQ